MKITEKQIEKMAAKYAKSENSAYTNDYYGFINGFKKALTLCGVINRCDENKNIVDGHHPDERTYCRVCNKAL